MCVVDSTVLIYLAKADLLSILTEIYGNVLCPPKVYEEVVERGGERGHRDAERVKREVGRTLIIRPPEPGGVEEVKRDSKHKGFRLGEGELEGVALSRETGETFLSDDDDAKNYAEAMGIEGKGTIYLILKAYRDGIISRDACSEAFEKMVQEGFRVGPEVACIFYRKLEEIASKSRGKR